MRAHKNVPPGNAYKEAYCRALEDGTTLALFKQR
jgi:hypothetical protein